MEYACSYCHTHFEVEDDGHAERCPQCGAEAGLEPNKGIPFAMRAFGLVLLSTTLLSLAGVVLSYSLGAGS